MQSNDQETSTPKSCTQGDLETINLDDEIGSTPAVNTLKIRFQPNEDKLLIQSWFNISKDSIVGVDKKGDHFWKRISEAYNKHCDKNCPERNFMALKGRWHKTINSSINKFVGCYKQAVGLKKSGSSESDIILAAHDIFHHDMHRKFTFEVVWRLMKDEPKWSASSLEPSSKRTKNSTSGAYSPSSNPPTPTSECNPPKRPIGQKAAKRKEKEKLKETSTTKFDTLKNDFDKKFDAWMKNF